MSSDRMAEMDFDRARAKAFWRRIFAWVTGDSNALLPFDDVRERVKITGQFYLGLKQVELNKIVGSSGRYRDFDRAFAPIQTRTRSRWVNIDIAHYEEIPLPPVELTKMGDIYFVKDGNHRVSVARERGQEFIDAYVVEVVVPFPLTEAISLDELAIQQERSDFFERTQLDRLRPDNSISTSQEGQYAELLEHIDVHRWYLGERRNKEVPYEEAVESWYDTVYLPLVTELRQQNLGKEVARLHESSLYLWVMKYVYYLRQTYQEDSVQEPLTDTSSLKAAKQAAVDRAAEDGTVPELRKLAEAVRKADWLVTVILSQERAAFFQQTGLAELVEGSSIETSVPGQYEKILEHIRVHRWYLGVQAKNEVSYREAVLSWYNHVYLPLVTVIRDQEILADFPGRTETDLYLWIISHQWYLRETIGAEISAEEATEHLFEITPTKRQRRKGKS